MAANQLIGTIQSIGATQELMSKTGNAFKRRELILMLRRFDPNTGEPITDSENTPQLTFIGDRCADLDNYQVGQVVSVSFDIQGRKYTDVSGVTKIINDIRPYKIEPYQPRTNVTPQVVISRPTSQPISTTNGATHNNMSRQVQSAQSSGYNQQGGDYCPF